jgi:hypothetical protein
MSKSINGSGEKQFYNDDPRMVDIGGEKIMINQELFLG